MTAATYTVEQLQNHNAALRELSRELLEIVKIANGIAQYLEPTLSKEDEDLFLLFYSKVNAVFMKDRPALGK